MNVHANAASRNWGKLFHKLAKEPEIDEETGYQLNVSMEVNLSDSQADLYDFANEVLMLRMRERLVETLQRTAYSISYLTFGNKFFMTMNEEQQRSFFVSIFNLRVGSIKVGEATDNSTESPAITICTPALLETLPQLHEGVECFKVSNFVLTGPSDVQVLSNIIGSKKKTLRYLGLESIECRVDDCNNKRDSDEPGEFLDPLFHVTSRLYFFVASTRTHSARSTVVSPTALRALCVDCEVYAVRFLILRGLGLTDSHVLAIVDGLSTTPGSHLSELNLESNPGISAQCYGALLNLINRANVIGSVSYNKWNGFCVDDKVWEGKLNLVSEMNSQYSRLEYLTNGTFTSAERRWQWLERAVGLPSSSTADEDERKKNDAKHLNFIWYTLCQNPEMMQVFQAPTRTRKRKVTGSTSTFSGTRSARTQR
jgi:hypothetical protein